jgi:hypothetical protein
MPIKKAGDEAPALFIQVVKPDYIFQLYWMPSEFWYISILLAVLPVGKYTLSAPTTSFLKPCM